MEKEVETEVETEVQKEWKRPGVWESRHRESQGGRGGSRERRVIQSYKL